MTTKYSIQLSDYSETPFEVIWEGRTTGAPKGRRSFEHFSDAEGFILIMVGDGVLHYDGDGNRLG